MDVRDNVRFLAKLTRREISHRLVKPTQGLLFITYRCSSRCTTCVMWQRGSSGAEMPIEGWKRFIDDAARARFINLEMFGGDALLRPEILFPAVSHATERGIPCDLTTNGLLLDSEAARQVVVSGTRVVYLSLDGVGETHDRIRGVPGAFEKALSGLRSLRAAREALSKDKKLPVFILNTTVSAANVRKLDSLVELAEEERPDVLALEYVGQNSDGAIQNSSVGGVLPDPYFLTKGGSHYLSEDDAEFLKRWVVEMHARGRPKNVVFNSENVDVLLPRHMSSGELPWKRCYVCRTIVILDPSGNVLCCPFFSRYHLGNIAELPLSEIWGNQRHREFIRAQGNGEIAICRECILSLQRNPTFTEAIAKRASQYVLRRRGRGVGLGP